MRAILLKILVHALDVAPKMRSDELDLEAVLNTLKAEFPKLEYFECDFLSLGVEPRSLFANTVQVGI